MSVRLSRIPPVSKAIPALLFFTLFWLRFVIMELRDIGFSDAFILELSFEGSFYSTFYIIIV